MSAAVERGTTGSSPGSEDLPRSGGEAPTSASVRPGLLARNMAWLTGGEVASRLIAFAVAVYLARVLGAEGFGTVGAALAFVTYFSIVVNAGLDPCATREAARGPSDIPELLSGIVSLRLAIALLMYGALAAAVGLLPADAVGRPDLALVFGASLFAAAIDSAWALRGKDEMRTVAMGLLIRHVVYAVGIFLFVRAPRPMLVAVPIVHVVAELVARAIYLGRLRSDHGRLTVPVDRERQWAMVRESVPVGVGKALRLVFYQGDVLLLIWLATAAQAGQFLASFKIVLALAALGLVCQENAFPTLSRLMEDERDDALAFQSRITRYVLVFGVPTAVGGAYLSEPVVRLLFGASYAPSAPVLATALFAVPVLAVSAGFQNQFVAEGRSRIVMFSEGVGVLLHLGLAAWWIPAAGALGAARANIAGRMGVLLLLLALSLRREGRRVVPGRLLPLAGAAGGMALTMEMAAASPFVVRAVAGAAAYVLLALVLGAVKPREFRELRRILRGQLTSDVS